MPTKMLTCEHNTTAHPYSYLAPAFLSWIVRPMPMEAEARVSCSKGGMK